MQKISPFLWFDHQAEEAANLYTSVFADSEIVEMARYEAVGQGEPGKVMTVTFRLAGQEFMALNGGPEYSFTPAVSFFVNCKTEAEIDTLWEKLSAGGMVLMELEKYPFSEKFGWLQDRFGVSWQLSLASRPQIITPFLMFIGEQHGKAEEAIKHYISLFDNSSVVNIERWGEGAPDPAGTVMLAIFSLARQEFMAMDSSHAHQFTVTPAISLFVKCKTQDEVDRLWSKLTDGGEEGPCGWLKDRYGVSWQIVPTVLGEMLQDKNPQKAQSVMAAMFQMKKLDIAALQDAYRQG